MTPQEIDAWLTRSLADRSLSRNEKQAFHEFVASLRPGSDRQVIRSRAFEIARAALANPDDHPVLAWLEGVVKALSDHGPDERSHGLAEAYFSPGQDCRLAISRYLKHAQRTADICVFTITDDRLTEALFEAHRRAVSVRIVSDDSKADDTGSDVERLRKAGIPVRLDRSPCHMHHKFALLDGKTLLTGSYNWTRGAADENEENLIVSDDPRVVSLFADRFDLLWAKWASVR
jgi:phosphatidylserine/phosphatidylglycerophosphate/cardiolipin synthase-like enzyme